MAPFGLIDFLNSREDAILFWTALVVAVVLLTAGRVAGAGLLSVLGVLADGKLLLIFGGALLYCAAWVFVAYEVGLWHTEALKATIYWLVGVGIVLVAEAVTRGPPKDRESIRRVAVRVAGVAVLVGFVLGLYVLPFVYELVGVFVLAFLPIVLIVHKSPSRYIEGAIAAVVFVYLAYVVFRALEDTDSLLTRRNAEDLFVGPALTVALVPLLFGVAWLSRRSQRGYRPRYAVITRAELGEDWPFTVEEGVLRCYGVRVACSVTFSAEGTEYAVNGTAKTNGYEDVTPIWADDPETGMRKHMGPVLALGLELCRAS